ncbi:molybdopterin molybdotransferase MoeA [Salinarimonas sp. NSM]|uniref:molybdopterin molybdotransferase MoeA n=1 Tax=Salinarimonas sp. NSM TaxID=3458003 RepID=UPI0040374F14
MPPLAVLDVPADDACACDRPKGALLSIDAAIPRAAAWASPITDVNFLPLGGARGRLLAHAVQARLTSPAFDRSAMDGYAVRAGDGLEPGARLSVKGRIAAGARGIPLGRGEAARIFTGAPIPPGADAVVMQEDVRRHDGTIVLDRAVRAGAHIRSAGEDVAFGDRLAEGGARVDARLIALLAAQGIAMVPTRRRPRVAVLSTGDELVEPGAPLGPAAIYDANRPMLLSLIQAAGCEVVDAGIIRDDPWEQGERLASLAESCDLLVTSGGASVGEEDHAGRALRLAGGDGEALAMALKPGKPALVGRIGAAAVLGLPGNPVSALVVFMLLGRAMLARLGGAAPHRPAGLPVPLAEQLARKPGRTEFVPGRLVRGQHGPRLALLSSNSARLRPLVEADGLAEIPTDMARAAPDTPVAFHAFSGLLC